MKSSDAGRYPNRTSCATSNPDFRIVGYAGLWLTLLMPDRLRDNRWKPSLRWGMLT